MVFFDVWFLEKFKKLVCIYCIIFKYNININICDEYKYILNKYIMKNYLWLIIFDIVCIILVLCGIMGYGTRWLSLNFCGDSNFTCKNRTVGNKN